MLPDFSTPPTAARSAHRPGASAGRDRRARSLHWHIALLVTACVVPSVIFAGFMLFRFADQQREIQQVQISGAARTISAGIDLELGAAIATLNALAISPDRASGDLAEFYRQCRRAAAQQGDGWILLAAPDGRQSFNTRAPFGSLLPRVTNTQSVRAAMLTGRPQVSDLFRGALSGLRQVAVYVPVIQNGETRQVLIMAFPAERVSDIFREQGISPGWTVGIIDRNNIILGRNRALGNFLGTPAMAELRDRMAGGDESQFVSTTKEGAEVYTAFTRSALSGWTVAVGVPIDAVETPLRHTLALIAGGGLVLLLIGLGLASAIGYRMRKSMRLLAAAALALGRGERVPTVRSGIKELDDVAAAQRTAGILMDERASARDRAEQALRESEERLAHAQKIARIGSWVRDLKTGAPAWSTEMYRIYQVSPESFVPAHDTSVSFAHPDDQPALRDWLASLADGGNGRGMEFRITQTDGTVRWLACEGEAIRDASGQVVKTAGTVRDVTEAKRLEQERIALEGQIHHSQKLEALGTLAGGIAHDLNNTLVPIVALTKRIERHFEPGSRPRQDLEIMQVAAQRARDLVQRILAFSRKDARERGPVDLAALATEALEMMHASLPATIKLESRFDAIPEISGDAGQLHQVMVNLVTNGAHAIGERTGTITVSLAVEEGGGWVKWSVADTGSGMDEATRARIFEPFFTTKQVGEGTGLGLAVVHGIVGSHGGRIEVASAPGRGTRVDIFLPASGAESGKPIGTTAFEPA